MKRFLYKSICFGVGIALTFVVIILFKVNTDNAFSALFQLKDKKLTSIADRSKILILGGSNARYAFDSDYLERKLKRPVVNTAITYHQGLSYYLTWSKQYLKPGDWVIVSPEYNMIASKQGVYGSYKLIDVAPADGSFFQFLTENPVVLLNQAKQAHMVVSESLNGLFMTEVDRKKLLAAHNDNGDAVNCNGKSEHFVATEVEIRPAVKAYFDTMREFAAYCRANKIKLFLNMPPVRQEGVVVKTSPEKIAEQLRDNLPGVILLNTFTNALYPDRLFYDSSYHLNTEGKRIHTRRLYADLYKSQPYRFTTYRK